MSRTHVSILGVQIPLDKLASVTSTPVVYATLGEWHNYYSSDWMKALFDPNPPFAQLAERKVIPIDAGARRQFFSYGDPTPGWHHSTNVLTEKAAR